MRTVIQTLAILAILWGGSYPSPGFAAPWATDLALQTRLQESVDIDFGEDSLRNALNTLSRENNLAVLLDRRVDPEQKIQISLHEMSLGDALKAMAENRGLGVAVVDSAAYFAPPAPARRVRTLLALREEEINRLPKQAAKIFLERKPMTWDDLAAPRDLVEQLAKEAGIEIAGLDRVPHDLWAAGNLPPLEWIARLTLIANQFDLTVKISPDGRRAELTPVPDRVEISRSYPAEKEPQVLAKKFAALAPQARIQMNGDKIVVSGLLEDHERIAPPPSPPRPATQTAPPIKVYSLKVVEKPLGPLLKQLAERMHFELAMDEENLKQAGILLDQRVSFSVEDATIDDLLRAALKNTALKFQRNGKAVKILPAAEK